MPDFITIEYLYNSGFAIDYKDCYIVVDYYKGHLSLPTDKTVVFIVTHSHADHYNPRIFDLPHSENAFYILSEDVEAVKRDGKRIALSDSVDQTRRLKRIYDRERVRRVAPNAHFDFAGIHFDTYGSTDRGVSIKFTVHGVTFFHAGDLNAWQWPDFSPEQQREELDDFVEILEEVGESPIDVGFMVLDGRLGENTFVGPDIYLDKLRPQILIPMHFRDDPELTRAFADRHAGQTTTRIQVIRAVHELIVVQA